MGRRKGISLSLALTVGSCLAQPQGPLITNAQEKNDTTQVCKCDFSRYKPLALSHFLNYATVKKVEPEYPAVAKAARVQGTVDVRILVDRNGDVVNACVVEGHPLLHAAAQSAASQWKFKKNFGLTSKQKRRYIQSSLLFTFRLDS